MSLRNPPGHRPALPVSTLSVYSALPQNSASVSRPPLATPWGVRSRSASNTTPFLPSSSRNPPQLPVSRAREIKSPPHVSGTGTGCALAGADVISKARPRTTIRTHTLISRPPRGSRATTAAANVLAPSPAFHGTKVPWRRGDPARRANPRRDRDGAVAQQRHRSERTTKVPLRGCPARD